MPCWLPFMPVFDLHQRLPGGIFLAETVPTSAFAEETASLVAWCTVVVRGRWIAYTVQHQEPRSEKQLRDDVAQGLEGYVETLG